MRLTHIAPIMCVSLVHLRDMVGGVVGAEMHELPMWLPD